MSILNDFKINILKAVTSYPPGLRDYNRKLGSSGGYYEYDIEDRESYAIKTAARLMSPATTDGERYILGDLLMTSMDDPDYHVAMTSMQKVRAYLMSGKAMPQQEITIVRKFLDCHGQWTHKGRDRYKGDEATDGLDEYWSSDHAKLELRQQIHQHVTHILMNQEQNSNVTLTAVRLAARRLASGKVTADERFDLTNGLMNNFDNTGPWVDMESTRAVCEDFSASPVPPEHVEIYYRKFADVLQDGSPGCFAPFHVIRDVIPDALNKGHDTPEHFFSFMDHRANQIDLTTADPQLKQKLLANITQAALSVARDLDEDRFSDFQGEVIDIVAADNRPQSKIAYLKSKNGAAKSWVI